MRNNSIDFVRAIAILIMLTANASPYLFAANTPFSFRLVCSLAAPLFTLLSGYTFAMNAHKSNGFKNGLYILVSALVVDCLAWGIPPFQTFDVLYVIALGQITLALFKRIPSWAQVLLMLTVLCLPVFIGANYRFSLSDPQWNTINFDVNRLLFDGWFPVFPWLGLPLLVYFIYKPMQSYHAKSGIIMWISLVVFILSLVPLYTYKSDQGFREGYVELFYPASLPFLLSGISFCIFLIALSQRLSAALNSNLINHVLVVGRHSMFVYILHAFLISNIIAHLSLTGSLVSSILVLCLFYGSIYLMSNVLGWLMQQSYFKQVPKWIRRPLGLY